MTTQNDKESTRNRVGRLLQQISEKMDVPVPSFGGLVTAGSAYYDVWTNRILVSSQFARQLSDRELSLVLAHEVGHARRRVNCMANNIAIVWPIIIPVIIQRLPIDIPRLVFGAVFLSAVVYAIYGNTWGRQREEFEADAFAKSFSDDGHEYTVMLRRAVDLLGVTVSSAQRRRMAQRYDRLSQDNTSA